jgi:hydrogenase maturation protein HypF
VNPRRGPPAAAVRAGLGTQNLRVGERVRVQAHVAGVVQGVGFRPFVHALATRLGLGGHVGNDGAGVFMEVEGDRPAVAEFLDRLDRQRPPLAQVERVVVTAVPPTGASRFEIAPSRAGGGQRGLVAADVATCPACLVELADPADRRYRHPFVNCTDCGPRFTIVLDLPYDRPNTTMAGFSMCTGCQREYADPADRRFHAQPVCCPHCGPRLQLTDPTGGPLPGDPVPAAAALLRAGQVLAVKGLGGYHLAADAADGPTVAALRTRKHRPDQPFAVMVADLAAAEELCELTGPDRQLLTGPQRPIVLLPRRAGAPVAEAVAPGSRDLGVLLPYTPLHHLLLAAVAGPLVVTSGNRHGEPIAHRDAEARATLGGIADAFLSHDRPIRSPAEDSVARTVRGRPLLLRRCRGYVPQPLALPWRFAQPVLACGAELKNTFCLGRGGHAFLSGHIGDLSSHEVFRSYTDRIEHLCRLLDIEPRLVAHDLHPDYLSTTYAGRLAGVELVPVQHHHAHIAACLADNAEAGPVIGVALDGLGYGTDGTLWGGELLVADLAGFRRVGHLAPVPAPGGDAATRQPWRMALSYLDAAFGGEPPPQAPVLRRHAGQWPQVRKLAAAGLAPVTSSAGRLFDAVASILGVRDVVSYEGQAAVELEQLADPAELGGYPVGIDTVAGEPLRLRGIDLVASVVDEQRRGVPAPTIAARFHNGLAAAAVAGCRRVHEDTGLASVALSGGVFQNALLLTRTVDGLAAAGFRVLTHSRVPPNDGGVSLGQAAVAAVRDAR